MKKPVNGYIVALLCLWMPAVAAAGSCESAATVAADVWAQYRQVVEKLGCGTKLGGAQEFVLCGATRLVNESTEDVVGWWNSVAKNRWATIGPRILGAEIEYGTVVLPGKRTFVSMVPSFNEGKIIVRGKSGSGKVTICAIESSGRQNKLVDDAVVDGNRPFNVSARDAEGKILAVVIEPRSATFQYEVEKQETPVQWNFGKIEGLADLHVHGAAHLGFGGLWLWGDHDGPQSTALRACRQVDALDAVSIAAQIKGLSVPEKEKLHAVPLDQADHVGETVIRHGKGFTHGNDSFAAWPHFSDIAHMQVHTDWLREAHRNGLKLVVMSAVNNELLCRLLRTALYQGENEHPCDDMTNLHRQIDAFNALDAKYDWFEVALTPWHARKIIHEGKLAVVLSAESSHMLPPSEGDFKAQLEKLYQKGLRSLQIVHERDNRFAGGAPHRENFWWHQRTSNPFTWITTTQDDSPFELDANGKNVRGLSDVGQGLIDAMIQRRMLIDIAHWTERGVADLYRLVTSKYDRYPFYASHSRLKGRLEQEEQEILKEFVTTDAQIEQIKAVGGMIGLRTGPNHIATDPASRVLNDCPGSSKSYAQMVSYAQQKNVDIAFGSDFNGVTQQLGPRVGDEGCYAARHTGRGTNVWNKRQASLPRAVPRFETEGLRHIGYLPDLYKDLVALNTNGVEALNESAEKFIVMWEKAYGTQVATTINSQNQCQNDGDCAGGQFCDAGVDTKDNACRAKKADGEACTLVNGGRTCQSGNCKFGRCYTANSKELGASCYIGDECRVGKCNNVADGVKGTCVCDRDADCGSGKWCDRGFDTQQNVCKAKLDKGQICGTVGELGVGHRCKSGDCKVSGLSKNLECK